MSFRRHRRLLVPLLLTGVVILWGGAIALGARALLLWDTWTIALAAVPLGVTWIAGGIPGGRRILPLRLVLLLALAGVPASALLVPAGLKDGEILVTITVREADNAVEVEPHNALRESVEPAGSRSPAAESPTGLRVRVDLLRRIPPLWWFPAHGWIETLTVEHRNASVRHLFLRTDARFSIVRELRARFEVIVRETRTLTIPDRPGWFLQPGRYTVQLAGVPAHPDSIIYRYTQQ